MFSLIYSIVYLVFLLAAFHTTVILLSVELESLVLGVQKENDDETYVNAQIFPNMDAIKEYLKGTVPTKEEVKKIMADVVSGVNSKIPNYKHIKNFAVRDKEFEKTTTQKIKRYGDNMKK